ncbi:MAG: hypothetical protein K9G64_03940 [Bacteroidia bacterium]|nr:hypothetical protein [Bacteroidia bacterium]
MKKIITLCMLALISFSASAQFGFFKKKSEIEAFKEKKIIVVLFMDSAYNAAVELAMIRNWKFSSFEVAFDNELLKYKKQDVVYLSFSKSKGSKNKAKLGSCEEDFNGLVLLNKFKRKSMPEDILAQAFCSNNIDTNDWEFELQRGVQMMNNYFEYASNAARDGDITASKMMANYPSDKNQLLDKKLLVEDKMLELKGKKDAAELFDGEVTEVDRDVIYKAIADQDNAVVYYLWVKDEKYCNKLVISAQNSELMYYETATPDKCKLNNKDLETLNEIKKNTMKKNSK